MHAVVVVTRPHLPTPPHTPPATLHLVKLFSPKLPVNPVVASLSIKEVGRDNQEEDSTSVRDCPFVASSAALKSSTKDQLDVHRLQIYYLPSLH